MASPTINAANPSGTVNTLGAAGALQANSPTVGLATDQIVKVTSSSAFPYYLYSPLGYQQITSLSSAISLTVPTGATLALIVIDSPAVRWRDDGTAPTASVGMLLTVGQSPFQYSGNLSSIQFIASSGSPILDISYYK